MEGRTQIKKNLWFTIKRKWKKSDEGILFSIVSPNWEQDLVNKSIQLIQVSPKNQRNWGESRWKHNNELERLRVPYSPLTPTREWEQVRELPQSSSRQPCATTAITLLFVVMLIVATIVLPTSIVMPSMTTVVLLSSVIKWSTIILLSM